jgi:hypothetical protein
MKLIILFRNEKSTYQARRLWNFLITKKYLHELFIRYIFKKKEQKQLTMVKREYKILEN